MRGDIANQVNDVISGGPPGTLVCEFTVHGRDVQPGWRVRSFDIIEELSGRYSAMIELEHDDELADPRGLLGMSATVAISRAKALSQRHRFSGIVRAVQDRGRPAPWRRRVCTVRLEPAFACLAEQVRTTRFQDMTVPTILNEVLREGLAPFEHRGREFRLVRASEPETSSRRFAIRELCVQYGESTYDFCRRILAEEGLSYFFEDADGGETIVVVDENSACRPLDEHAIPFVAPGGPRPDGESVFVLFRTRGQSAQSVKLQSCDLIPPGLAAGPRAPSGRTTARRRMRAASQAAGRSSTLGPTSPPTDTATTGTLAPTSTCRPRSASNKLKSRAI